MTINMQDQIGEIVARDYRTAAIFKASDIDFCCRGKRTLEDVIREKGLRVEKMVHDLEEVTATIAPDNINFSAWPLDLLTDYIEKKHHRYVAAQIPVLTDYLTHILRAHGKTHPGIQVMYDLFAEGAVELARHMEIEETMLFPVVRNMTALVEKRDVDACIPLSILENVVSILRSDHTEEGDRWRMITEKADQLNLTCNTARVTFALLHEFEEDLHQHIHLENNILFPAVIRISEEKIKAQQS